MAKATANVRVITSKHQKYATIIRSLVTAANAAKAVGDPMLVQLIELEIAAEKKYVELVSQ